MGRTWCVVTGLLLLAACKPSEETASPEPAAEPAEAAVVAAPAETPAESGHVGCDVEGKKTWVSCTSPGEREACCTGAAGTPNDDWCPPNCALDGDSCEC